MSTEARAPGVSEESICSRTSADFLIFSSESKKPTKTAVDWDSS